MSTKATFQCSLCPKRFTRAFNLRSHLRTHTDERPFVCSVCGKAFARHHDRKSHEALHSGEKKFVCQGNLVAGGTWGCSRKFAQAKNLGRHFRSETGRACILPLIVEEAKEKQQQPLPWTLDMLKQRPLHVSEHSSGDQSIAWPAQSFRPEFSWSTALMPDTPRPSPSETAFPLFAFLRDWVPLTDDKKSSEYGSLRGPLSGKAGDELQWTVHSGSSFGLDIKSFNLRFGNASVPAMRTKLSSRASGYEHTIQAIVPAQISGQTTVELILTFEHPLGLYKVKSPSNFTYSLHPTFAAASTAGQQARAASDLDPLDPAAQVDLLKGALHRAGIELGALLRGEVNLDKRPSTKAKSCLHCRRSKLKCCQLYSDGPGPCDRCVTRNLSCVR